MPDNHPIEMKSLQVHSYGEPSEVLQLFNTSIPKPGYGQVRIRVHVVAFNPADWAVCRGFFPLSPPRGIGFDVSGLVDEVGEGVEGLKVGDAVFGVPDYLGFPTAGASEYSVLNVWHHIPIGLSMEAAACLPMAVETATRSLDLLGLQKGQTIMINGGGTMTGFAAVQIALLRGAEVIVSAGKTFEERLKTLGAKVTPYGEGMVERVRALAGGSPDFVLHTANVADILPSLIKIVDNIPERVMSFSDFDQEQLGVRTTGREKNIKFRYEVLGMYARLASEGKFSIPISRIFTWADWHEAIDISMSGQAHGKLLLIIGESE